MIYLFDGMDDASGYIKNIQLVGGEATTDKKGLSYHLRQQMV